jgi:hypothetical protein
LYVKFDINQDVFDLTQNIKLDIFCKVMIIKQMANIKDKLVNHVGPRLAEGCASDLSGPTVNRLAALQRRPWV